MQWELHAQSLLQCYQTAVSQNESIQIALEKISQSDAQIEQGWDAVWPKIRLNGSEFFQDTSGLSGAAGVPSSLVPSQRSEYKLNLYQPLFQGFREWTALEAFKSQKAAQEYRVRRTKVLLFQEIAQNFYAVILRERDLKNLSEVERISAKRIEELKRRVYLGKSRTSELTSAQAQLANVLAQKEQLAGEILNYRQNLSYLTAQDFSQVVLDEEVLPEARLMNADEIKGFIEKRSDIMALQQDYETQKKLTDVGRGNQSPVLSLQGNYYLKRSGYQSAIPWDVLLALDWPLFQGGADTGLIKQHESQERVLKISLAQAKRQAFAVLKNNFSTYAAVFAQARELRKAYEFAKQTYSLQENEYAKGLANNLDVLLALNTLMDTKRSLDRSEIQLQLNALQLKIDREEAP